MANGLDDAMDQARGNGSPGRFLDLLVEKLGTARAETVFGAPVERDGVTVIPVARVRWGAGGGGGTSPAKQGDGNDAGSGGGGGLMASPVGYIELRGGQAHFIPIRDFGALAPLVLAAGVAALFVLHGLRRLLR